PELPHDRGRADHAGRGDRDVVVDGVGREVAADPVERVRVEVIPEAADERDVVLDPRHAGLVARRARPCLAGDEDARVAPWEPGRATSSRRRSAPTGAPAPWARTGTRGRTSSPRTARTS